MPKESLYVYRGSLFHEYMELDSLKEDAQEQLSYKDQTSGDIESFYTSAIQNAGKPKGEIDKIFFENILYSHLKHVFVNKIQVDSGGMSETTLKKRVTEIIKNLNHKETIPAALFPEMVSSGFYLMDRLHITKEGTTFLAGYDYHAEKGKVDRVRFLLAQVVLRKKDKKPTYFAAGIEIDFNKKVCLIMIKNVLGIQKADLDEEEDPQWDNTVNRLYQRVWTSILSKLAINTYIDVIKDRKGMFQLCKELDDKLLDDVRQKVKGKTASSITRSVNEQIDLLFTDKKPTKKEKDNYAEKITSLLIAIYINTKIKKTELLQKARNLKLIGYTTRIAFTSNRASKGSAGSSGGAVPVATSEMFHSLYTDFKDALMLPKWSMSWFSDYLYKNPKDKDYIQTNIYSTTRSFKVVFLAKRPLKREFIHHVVEHLNKNRNY